LDIRRIGAIKQGDEVVGSRTKVKIVKNKVAPPFREAEFDILYGTGISREGEVVDLGAEDGLLEKSGSWYSFAGERIGQGRENAKEFLRDHPEVAAKIETAIRAKRGVPEVAAGRKASAAAAAVGNGADSDAAAGTEALASGRKK
jgi:recombination protein RecA